jgi:hypothetical protein
MIFLIVVVVIYKLLESQLKIKRTDKRKTMFFKTVAIIGLTLIGINSIFGYSPYNSVVSLCLIYILSVASNDSLQNIIPNIENYDNISGVVEWTYDNSEPKYFKKYKKQDGVFNRIPNIYRDQKNDYSLKDLYPKQKVLDGEVYTTDLEKVKKNLLNSLFMKNSDNSVFESLKKKKVDCDQTTTQNPIEYDEMDKEETWYDYIKDELKKIFSFYRG